MECEGKYGLKTGRVIVCRTKKDGANEGRDLFSIEREGFAPAQADAMAHYIVDKLNESKDFDDYFERYLRDEVGGKEHYE